MVTAFEKTLQNLLRNFSAGRETRGLTRAVINTRKLRRQRKSDQTLQPTFNDLR